MNAADLTGILGGSASIGSLVIMVYLAKTADRRADAKLAAKAEKEQAATSEVSWEAINKAIAKERDDLRIQLQTQAQTHRDEMRELRIEADRKADLLREQYEQDLRERDARIAVLEKTTNQLYRELHNRDR